MIDLLKYHYMMHEISSQSQSRKIYFLVIRIQGGLLKKK